VFLAAAPPHHHGMATKLAALSLGINNASGTDVPDVIQLTPPGPSFRATDGSGRPREVPGWRIDAALAAALKARIGKRANLTVLDYEHQTLAATENGQPAPAAGWFRDLDWRDGEGLFATGVEWTPRAAAMLRAGEYKYISPVFEYDDRTGDVINVQMAALTNNPGLGGLRAVLRAANGTIDNEESMNLDDLRKSLGLPPDADDKTVLAAVAALKARAETADGELVALRARVEEKDGEVAVLRAKAAERVPLADVNELRRQVVALTAQITEGEVNRLVDEAKAAGKVIGDEHEKDLRALRDVGHLKAILKAIVAQTPSGTQTNGRTPEGAAGGAPDNAALAVMKALGMTPEQFAKGKE
jgi:phage I-like protein